MITQSAENDPVPRPLLTGARSSRAWGAVRDIAASLRHRSETDPVEYRLIDGLSGQALFHAELGMATDEDREVEWAFRLIERSIDGVRGARAGTGLMFSFTGVAWLVEHLDGRICEADEEDLNDEIDNAIVEILRAHRDDRWWQGKHDVMSGLAGLGVYALERLPRPSGREMVSQIIDRLDATCKVFARGISWPSPVDTIPAELRQDYPDGILGLGVAHGSPGVIGFLGRAYATGIEKDRVRRLLDGAVDWLLAHRLDGGQGSSFGNWSGDLRPTRSSWCYGNLGIAPCLLTAARTTLTLAWERIALELALEAADRPAEDAGVIDSGFCHGACGLAHLFHRLYRATGHPRLKESAEFWFDATLEMRRPGEGLGGFLSYRQDEDDPRPVWKADPGLLTGASGIGLALLTAVSQRTSPWDRIFLADIPKDPVRR